MLSRRTAVGFLIGSLAAAAEAVDVAIGDDALKRAVALARGNSAALTAFHRRYAVLPATPDGLAIEVVTEFRRAVLSAEERFRLGERLPETLEIRRLQQALAPFRGRIAVRAHVRLSPQTAYVTLPPYEVILTAPGQPDLHPLNTERTPLYSGAGTNTYLAGADIESTFEAAPIAQATRRLVLRIAQQDIGTTTANFATLD